MKARMMVTHVSMQFPNIPCGSAPQKGFCLARLVLLPPPFGLGPHLVICLVDLQLLQHP